MLWKSLLGILATALLGTVVLIAQADMKLSAAFNVLFGTGVDTPAAETIQSTLKTPDGFSIGLYASNINNARFMQFTKTGDLVIAQPLEARVTLIERDRNGDGVADGARVLLDNLVRPHSVDFYNGYLYVAESNAVGRVAFDQQRGALTGDYEQIITGLGDDGGHYKKTIRFGPDGYLYLSSGSTCNVCIEEDEQRATITRYRPDGSGEERYATGLRNAVGLDFSPVDGALYATDNGRDMLGDDYPPCELNKVEAGKFYGWPYVNGFGDLDPDFGNPEKLAESTPPVHGFRAHNAPLGIRFINIDQFPDEYQNAALVALHGSWNRSTYDGYKVVSLHQQADGSFDERDFIWGFEEAGTIRGRPVDVAVGPDQCVYVSDDYAMAIYRVCYGEKQQRGEKLQSGENQQSVNLVQARLVDKSGLEIYSEREVEALSTKGEALFTTRGCTACHTVERLGQHSGLKQLTKLNQRYSVASLQKLFQSPPSPMPPVMLESKNDEVALAAYLLQLQ